MLGIEHANLTSHQIGHISHEHVYNQIIHGTEHIKITGYIEILMYVI